MPSVIIKETSKALEELNVSSSVAQFLAKSPRVVETPDLSKGVPGDPVFCCILIDASGSMEKYTQDVIEGQLDMIQALRGSHQCKQGRLFVIQYLFDDEAKQLHGFEKLSPTGVDEVKLLKSGKYYNPRNYTALYNSIFYLLQDMAANIANAYNSGLKSTFIIGVITDGLDTEKGVQPTKIKELIQELQSKDILRNSVIVGLTHKDFTKEMVDEIKFRLGFQEAISISRNPKEIRKAFLLMSESLSQNKL